MVVMAEKLRHSVEEQEVHTVGVLVSRRDLGDFFVPQFPHLGRRRGCEIVLGLFIVPHGWSLMIYGWSPIPPPGFYSPSWTYIHLDFSRTKHIDIRHHFLRDHAQKGDITLDFVRTEDQLADIFTKPLNENQFVNIRRQLGFISL